MSLVRAVSTRWLAVILAVVLMTSPLTPVQHVAAADQNLVFAALHVLEDEYVDPVQPVALLNAAIVTLRKAANLSATALPEIPSGTPSKEAEAVFAATFARAAQASPMPQTQLAYAATAGMLASLKDTHTNFLDPQQFQENRMQLLGRPGFTGIGVLITSRKDPATNDGWIFVEDVFPGSPAESAGLKRFDRIIQVDGRSLKNATSQDASQYIRGPAGSSVTLTVMRGEQTLQLPVVRAPIQQRPVEARFIQPGVAYVKLYEFSRGSGARLRSTLLALALQDQLKSVVLDLRANPGGLIHEAVAVGSLFLPPRTVLSKITERGHAPDVLQTSGVPLFPKTPLVVLIDGGSASASEILAGAFRDHHRATIVGEKTAGALGGSITVPLPERAGMSVTVERITTPQGTVVEGVGITPDVAVALTINDMMRGEDTQLTAALRVVGAQRTHLRSRAA
ncbi:MAG TPA: S41 family peptidase [bacterium]|nr:S41 family peptidase [bacterium]